MSGSTTPIPSCVLDGKRLEDLALYDVEGKSWEFRKKKGPGTRLVLLDFWYTGCGPCLMEIPFLNELKRTYGPWGLEVVGIACESGPREKQALAVRTARGRFAIDYTLLLSSNEEPCPVKKQFQISKFPTVVLLDETGTIIWRAEGMGEQRQRELTGLIVKKLRLR
jgi:thiol-disulfide isomerase/thioredoxin